MKQVRVFSGLFDNQKNILEDHRIDTTRFQDKNLTLYSFYNRIIVQCPNCQQSAEVNTDLKTYRSSFNCYHCHHQIKSENKIIDLSVKVYCDSCANRISIAIHNVKIKKQAIKIKCPECGDTHSYQPTYTEYIGYVRYNTATDPFLGFELWYQAQFKDELFWAYNSEHLLYLEQYIAAKIRERNNPRYMTMVEKLPIFIKSAKNRKSLLKLINKLKNKSSLKHQS